MNLIGLISCVSKKKSIPSKACDLYISPLFQKSKKYAQQRCEKYMILSAKYGLLNPQELIEPYNMTLNDLNKSERQSWADKVFLKLKENLTKETKIIFLAGENYRHFLEKKIQDFGIDTATPLINMSIGEQLQWYKNFEENLERVKCLDNFYRLIQKLEKGLSGGIKLKDTSGDQKWPEKGVYFFFEESEFRKTAPFENRVVRVGTHAVSEGSNSTLWNRLRTHRGGTNLSGNHRGSIFRLHVGNSIIKRENIDLPSWGIGANASKETKENELFLENKVSEVLGEMRILWLAINDIASSESDRSYIEKNSIALLSTFKTRLDTASCNWLGNYNTNKAISKSSLWNVNYVDDDYDPRFIEILDQYVDMTLGLRPTVNHSIVPKEWWRKKNNEKQLIMFD